MLETGTIVTDKHTTDSKEIDINFEEACQNHCYIQTEDFHECSLQSVMGHKFYRGINTKSLIAITKAFII